MKENKKGPQNIAGSAGSGKTAVGKDMLQDRFAEWVKDNNWMCGYEGDDDEDDDEN